MPDLAESRITGTNILGEKKIGKTLKLREFYSLFFFEPEQDGSCSIFMAEHLGPAYGTPALLSLV